MRTQFKQSPLLITALVLYCQFTISTHAGNDRQFQKQYQRELSLASRKVPLSTGFPNTLPQKKKVSATMKDAFKLALSGNQTIRDSMAAYDQAVLNFQETMFQFQFSAGTLTYTHTRDIDEKSDDQDLSLSISQTFPFGFQYSLSDDLSDDSDDDTSQTIDLSFTQSIIGPTRAENRNTIMSARQQLASAKSLLRNNISNSLADISEQFRNIIFSQEALNNMQLSLRSVKANMERAELLLKMGFIAQSDLDTIKIQEINTQISIDQQQFTLRETRNKLKINLGLSTNDELILLTDSSMDKENEKVLDRVLKNRIQHKKSMIWDTLTKSAPLIDLRFSLNNDARSIEIAKRSNGLQIDVNGNYEYTSSSDTYDRSIGMTMSLPFDRRSNNNTIQSSRISTKLGRQMFLNNCLSLFRQESDNYNNILYHHKRVALTAKQLETSRRIDEASKIKFKYGSISATDLQQNHQNYLDSINNLRQAENTYASNVDNYRQLTNRYLEDLPVALTPNMDLIFQTQEPAKDRTRYITVPRIVVSLEDFDPDKPYRTCQLLMNAKIANM